MKRSDAFTMIVILFTALFGLKARAQTPETIVVPEGDGRPVLLDGLFSPGEWDDARIIEVHERVDLLVKVNSGHLFLGLRFKDALGVIADLYLSDDDRTVCQFHSSGQLGEGVHVLPIHEQMPSSVIGYAKDWDANEIKSDGRKRAEWQAAGRPPDKYRETLYPSDGKEYQIRLSKFTGRRLKMRLLAGDREGLIIVPEKSDLESTSGWLVLAFGEGRP